MTDEVLMVDTTVEGGMTGEEVLMMEEDLGSMEGDVPEVVVVDGNNVETMETSTANVGGSQVGLRVLSAEDAPANYSWVWWLVGALILVVVIVIILRAGKKDKKNAVGAEGQSEVEN